jgi:hypothetical protein
MKRKMCINGLLCAIMLSALSAGCAQPAATSATTATGATNAVPITSAAQTQTSAAPSTANPTTVSPITPPTATTPTTKTTTAPPQATTVIPTPPSTLTQPATISTKDSLPAGVLAPSQVDSSLINKQVTVQGEILQLIEDPGGQGGAYLKLGDGKGTVGLRIEKADWDALGATEKAKYQPGKTVTVSGMLVLSGQELVIVMMKAPPATATVPSGNATFVVRVPANTAVSFAVSWSWSTRKSSSWGSSKWSSATR